LPPEPRVLAFDTSAAHCAAALLCGDATPLIRVEEMPRGQSERLVPMLEDLLAEAGVAGTTSPPLGVGTGPGNFTGIRIAVATARGLALALRIPAIGVTGFDATGAAPGTTVLMDAPRGQSYAHRAGSDDPPRLLSAEEAAALPGPIAPRRRRPPRPPHGDPRPPRRRAGATPPARAPRRSTSAPPTPRPRPTRLR
jgi:tRNA threonylcarbamoyladenosine biosynthesis protein TsaB